MAFKSHFLLLGLIAGLALVAAYHGPDLPPGPFCGQPQGKQCCEQRMDSCSHPIMGTLCYCDEFCNRTIGQDDCCPDYEAVCLGKSPDIGQTGKGECIFGHKKTVGCNLCTCKDEFTSPPVWECEQDLCLISADLVSKVNTGPSSWRARTYTEYEDKKLKDAMTYRLGTFPLSSETKHMNPIRYDKDIPYPRDFDSRNRWPGYIADAADQGWCGSDWAVSIANIASDRFAIQSNGAEKVSLAPQSLLSCNVRGQQACEGGHIDVAWNFAVKYGLVDEDCFPYVAKKVRCPYKIRGSLIDANCISTSSSFKRTAKYKVGPPYRIKYEKDIMFEIMESGPVQAVMTVYQDFFHYNDGVYRHTSYGDQEFQGLHSVRIVGWGEDADDKYWIVANSWGREWGENGFFRIARGSNESGIESFIISVFSEVIHANNGK